MNEPELRNAAASWQKGIGAALTLAGAILAATTAEELPSLEQYVAYAAIPLAGVLGGLGGLLTARSGHRRLLIRLAPPVFVAAGLILSNITARASTTDDRHLGLTFLSDLLTLGGAFITGFWWHVGRRGGRAVARRGDRDR